MSHEFEPDNDTVFNEELQHDEDDRDPDPNAELYLPDRAEVQDRLY